MPRRSVRPAPAFADANLITREWAVRLFSEAEGLTGLTHWAEHLERYNGKDTRLVSHAPLLSVAAVLPTQEQGIAMVRALVAAGFDPNPPFTGRDWPSPAFGLGLRRQDTPLTAAIRAERPALVKALLDLGAEPNPKIPVHHRKTHPVPLLLAAEVSPDSLQHLLNAGVSPDLTDHQGQSALLTAVLKGRDDSVERLLAAGADVLAPAVLVDRYGRWNGYGILHAAVEGSPDVLRRLIEAGASLTVQSPWNNATPLNDACGLPGRWRGSDTITPGDRALRLQRVGLLLDAGAPVDQKMAGTTTLYVACDRQAQLDWDVLDRLVDAGADLNHRSTAIRRTPLDALEGSLRARPQTNRRDAARLQDLLVRQERRDLAQVADAERPESRVAVRSRPRL